MNIDESKLSESIEDYIERIYIAHLKDDRGVRITDLAESMNVSKASANEAVKRLKKLGYVEHEKYRPIYLTENGMNKGAQIYDKHLTIKEFLNKILNVDAEIAERDACCIEHIISEETFQSIKEQLAFYNSTL